MSLTDTNAKTGPMTGRCVCGDLTYRLDATPLFTHACHCLDCQRETGTAFKMTTIIVTSDLSITHGVLGAHRVGPRRTRYSCARCDTTIYVSSTRFTSTVTLSPGTLDDTRVATPQAHIWVCRKQVWLSLPDDVPQFEFQYEQEKVWPAESLARLKAIRQTM